MTIRLTQKTRIWIKDLATAYSGFNEANGRDFGDRRDNGLLVWGEYLLIAQDILGVEMHERQMLVDILASVKERIAHRERVAA